MKPTTTSSLYTGAKVWYIIYLMERYGYPFIYTIHEFWLQGCLGLYTRVLVTSMSLQAADAHISSGEKWKRLVDMAHNVN